MRRIPASKVSLDVARAMGDGSDGCQGGITYGDSESSVPCACSRWSPLKLCSCVIRGFDCLVREQLFNTQPPSEVGHGERLTPRAVC